MTSVFILAVLSIMPSVDKGATVHVLPQPEPQVLVEPLAAIPPPPQMAKPNTLCQPGLIVMIPDGREGQVTSYEDGICRVLAYGEAYVSLWTDEMIEPVYPQHLLSYQFGH
jgi:hypothetical protein